MRRFEYRLVAGRGGLTDQEINVFGAEGWDVAAAYAEPEGASAIMVHRYVLRREIEQPATPSAPADQPKGKRRALGDVGGVGKP